MQLFHCHISLPALVLVLMVYLILIAICAAREIKDRYKGRTRDAVKIFIGLLFCAALLPLSDYLLSLPGAVANLGGTLFLIFGGVGTFLFAFCLPFQPLYPDTTFMQEEASRC